MAVWAIVTDRILGINGDEDVKQCQMKKPRCPVKDAMESRLEDRSNWGKK